MEICIELISNFIQIFILMRFLAMTFEFKNEGVLSKIWFTFSTFLAFVELSLINYVTFFDGFWSLIVVLTFVVYAKCCLKGKFIHQLFVIMFAMAIIFTMSTVVLFFFSYIMETATKSFLTQSTYLRYVMMAICRITEYFVFRFAQKMNAEYTLSKKEWFLFAGLPILTWIAVTLVMSGSLEMKHINTELFYIILILVVIDIFIYFFMYKIKQDADTKLENKMLKMQYDSIKRTETDLRALSENTYSLRHDLKDRFLAVRVMAEGGKCDEIMKYVDKICDKELGDTEKIIFTNNDVFNALVNTKLELCKQKDIFCNISIQNEAADYIQTTDISVLLGNMFNNAIEAAEKSKEKLIIFALQIQEDYVSIYMENTYDPDCSDTRLKTTKKNKNEHGYGTKNMKKVVKENGGMIDFFVNEQDRFCCDALYKICKNEN